MTYWSTVKEGRQSGSQDNGVARHEVAQSANIFNTNITVLTVQSFMIPALGCMANHMSDSMTVHYKMHA